MTGQRAKGKGQGKGQRAKGEGLRLLSVIVVAAFLASAVSAAQPQGSRVPTGTASITGRVIDRESRQPVDQVLVSLIGAMGRQSLSTLTDADGVFRFEGIGPGDYGVVTLAPGFAPARYGQSDIGASPDEIVHVDAGDARKLFDLALVRAGAITGRVTDASGAPLKDVDVGAVHVVGPRVYRLLGETTSGRSNAQGEYTVRNLTPGTYQVIARRVDVDAMKAGANPAPPPGFLSRGHARGGCADRAGGVGRDRCVASTSSILHRPRSTERPPAARQRQWSDHRQPALRGTSIQTIRVDAEGRFDVRHLSPGLYTIWATSHADGSTEAATLTMQIDSDTTDLSLPLQATGRISGRVSTVDGAPLPSGSLQIAAILSAGGEAIDPLPRDRADIAGDGSFELSGLLGERVLRVTGLDPTWRIERITHGRTPVRTLTIPPGEALHDITVVSEPALKEARDG